MNDAASRAVAMGEVDPEFAVPPAFSDEYLALRFAALHKNDLRYVDAWRRWFIWDGAQWVADHTLRAFELSRTICRKAAAECNKNGAARIASAATVAAVARLTRADRKIAATVGQWDADDWLLNTPRGVVDLHSGKVRAHRCADYMTKITAIEAGGECPLWNKFLKRATDGDDELVKFLQRMAGYALTGSTREHALFFLCGTGANGKSVFLGTLSRVLGDYAMAAPMETFVHSHTERHPTDLAAMRGARLVIATETEEGRRWAESKIKALTGGDPIRARFMRQDFFEFIPTFKLVIAGNHRPGLRNVDEAMRRRMNLIPFTVTIPEDERDPDLADRLKEEWPGILQWAIDGCLEWLEHGLAPPQAVRQATQEYLAAEDALARWIEERCITTPTGQALLIALYADWRDWAEKSGEFVGPKRRFSQVLEDRGFIKFHSRGGATFEKIALKK